MKKILYLACAVAIGMFASCQNDAGTGGVDDLPEGMTYMGLRIRLPQGVSPSTRAYAGKVEGWDQIETFDYYLLTSDGTDIVTKGRLTGADVDWKRDTDPNSAFYGSWIVSPQVPFAVKPGEYKLIVVANCPETLMDTAPGATEAYQLGSTLTLSGLARPSTDQTYTTPGGSVIPRDIVTMSGRNTDPATIIIEPNVTQQQVNMEQLNMAKLQITRVPSRVIVTTPLDMTAPIPVDNPTLGVIGSITDLNWSVAQGSNSVYVFPYLLQPNNDVNTPGYSYVPGSNYNTTANQYYDYSDLQNKDFAVQPLPATSGEIPYVAGKFLLENTHASGVDQTTSNYKQGNTAYCLIRGTFTPASFADSGTPAADGTFYKGSANGLFYTSAAAVTDETDGGIATQDVFTHPQGNSLYYVWLNPDDTTSPVNSPVVRNSIYHINITGFADLGLNGNPLYPDDPSSPNPAGPNPDPKPSGPGESGTTPMDPSYPLSPVDTYMSIEATVLPWEMYSYDINL